MKGASTLIIFVLAYLTAATAVWAADRPNIVLIMADDK
jgi:hypothetical protein